MSCLATAACGDKAGNFCDVVDRPVVLPISVSAELVATDRGQAERIAVTNRYGRAHCPGWR